MGYSTGNLAIPLPDYLFEGLASISAANNDLRAVLAASARSNSGGHNSSGEKEGQFSFFLHIFLITFRLSEL
ncbi:hypothetical protein H9L39_13148 [Fusarium oxysporum f. sp. albedinis]|nr:hypothetical protein H9L39_13148 [Fusarium oxysporum f. sp. albedinis]